MSTTTPSQPINPSANVAVAPETDRGVAFLLIEASKAIQVETNHKKELLQRQLARQDKLEAERDEQRQALLPSRKRERDFQNTRNEIIHQDRMQRLLEMRDNNRRTRQCEIDRIALKTERILNRELREAQRTKELNDIEMERRAFHLRLTEEETQRDNARRIANMQRQATEKLEDEQFRQREEAAELDFKRRRKEVKRRYLLADATQKVEAKQSNLDLFEQHGASIPDQLF